MLAISLKRFITTTAALVIAGGIALPVAASANDLTVSGTLTANTINATTIQAANVTGTGFFATSGALNGNDIQTNSIWSSGGMTTGGVVTITQGGLHVTNGGIIVTGNSTITGSLSGLTGLTVNSGTANFGTGTSAPVHIISAQATGPTGSASMTGISSVSVQGSDSAGEIVAGGTPTGAGTITVTYNQPYSTGTPIVIISPVSPAAAAAGAYVQAFDPSGFTITTTVATPGATLVWYYWVVQ